ncbi:MAG: DUF3800 domain-containing protein [Candidatus Woesebacteria bacterium]|nr:DUF3800 domain-containing protein [Candidatus Woesebacteria bacterium]
MVIFIDESGVHKIVDHSSFAVVYVEVKNVMEFRKRLVEINKSLNIDSFHWSEQRWSYRSRYLKRVINLDFNFKVAIFDNPVNIDMAFDRIFEHLIRETNIRSIIIDGKKPKWYERKLKKELRNLGVRTKKLKTVRKEISEPGLQLADALAGFSLYCFENSSDVANKRLFEKFRRSGKLFVQMVF